jgi:hypothetical protein
MISSPETALFIAVCIDSPEWTEIWAAAPGLEPNVKMRRANAKAINLFI